MGYTSDAICQCGQNLSGFNEGAACDASNWPDLDHGLVCGPCKALVDNMKKKYITCNNYCKTIGRICSGAWEERGDSCEVKSTQTCSHNFTYTSDAICQCGQKLSAKKKEAVQPAEKKEAEQTAEKKEGEQTSEKKEGEQTAEIKEGEQTSEKKEGEQTSEKKEGEQTTEKKEAEQTAEK